MDKRLERNREWKAHRRLNSDEFLKAEQKSRDKYNEFTKLSRTFAKAYPWDFAKFLQGLQRSEQMNGSAVAASPSTPDTSILNIFGN